MLLFSGKRGKNIPLLLYLAGTALVAPAGPLTFLPERILESGRKGWPVQLTYMVCLEHIRSLLSWPELQRFHDFLQFLMSAKTVKRWR